MWSPRSLLCASLAAFSSIQTASGTVFDPYALQVPRHDGASQEIEARDPFSDQVKWTDWTSGDGTKEGGDGDKVWYVKDAIKLYLDRVQPENRNGVFWAGGSTTEDDFDYIDEFIESPTRLDSTGVKAADVYPIDDFTKMGLDGINKDGRWWRAINRMSKALAAAAAGDGIAYVYLKPVNCRTIFSPPSQNPMDSDPTKGGQATNGEIWYYAELPTLMRNLNIKQIVTFHKNGRKFVTDVAWDAERDAATHPRTMFDDIAMDASPIILPPEAGRGPLRKRQALAAAPFANTTWTSHTSTPESTVSTTPESSPSTAETELPSGTETLPSDTTTGGPSITNTPSLTTPSATTTGASSTEASITEVPALPSVTEIDGTTVISGGYITEPIPVTETETLDPSDAEATESAQAIQTELDRLIPVVQEYIDNPDEEKADDSDDVIVAIIPLAAGLLGKLPTDDSPKPCSSGNLITSLFNAVSCVTENLIKLQDEIQAGVIGGFGNMPAVVSTLGTITGLKEPLNNKNEDDNNEDEDEDEDEDDDDDEDEDEDEKTSTAETATETETCTATSTASDCHVYCPTATESVESASCSTTCFSTVTGCDITATTSTTFTGGEACPMPTDFTSVPEPAGPFKTAWWDYGLSCAGGCGGFIDSPSDFPVDETLSITGTAEETTATATATDPSTTITPTPSASETTGIDETTEATTETESSTALTPTLTPSSETTEISETTTEVDETTTFSTDVVSSTETTGVTSASGSTATSGSIEVTTTFSSSPATTTGPEPTGPYPCHHRGGPRIETPYCQCTTVTEGQTFFATAPLTDYVCAGYSTFPESVTPTAPTGPYYCHHRGGPNVEEPYCQCTTETLGQTFYTTAPTTHFVCAGYTEYPGEVQPTPTQVHGEEWRCDDARDSCQWALEQYDDDTVYTEAVARLAYEDTGFFDWLFNGDVGCVVNYECEEYGDGMSGRQIKEAVDTLKNTEVEGECGKAELSNTCSITIHFCMDDNGDCYYTPNYGQEG